MRLGAAEEEWHLNDLISWLLGMKGLWQSWAKVWGIECVLAEGAASSWANRSKGDLMA